MAITRRQFITGAVGAGAAGAVGRALSQQPWHQARAGDARAATTTTAPTASRKGTLVLVTLYGGNDGLDTVIPFGEARYLGARGELVQSDGGVLPLADGLALHPALAGFKGLWDAKQLAIVRGVGYPEPNRSHFVSMDIWQSGSTDGASTTGWLGRWLDATGNDPLRDIAVGASVPQLLKGEKVIEESGSPPLATSVTRRVYDQKGKLLYENTWYSSYVGEKEKVRVGTKKPPKPKVDPSTFLPAELVPTETVPTA